MSDLPRRGGGAEGSVPDIEFRFNQMELPDELPDDFAEQLTIEAAAAGLRASVVVEPGRKERDFIVVPILVVVHFAHAHAVDLAIATAGAAIWDAIKRISRKARTESAPQGASARVLVQYKDGPEIEVDLENDAKLLEVLTELRSSSSERA
jgi:hypothetical protein